MRTLVADLLVIGGRFRLVRHVGEGGMGVVWEATEVTSGRGCALKFLRDTTPDVQKRFLREAEAANAVHHPCILHIHELLQDDDGSFAFVMDLLEGESLATRLERQERISLGQTAAILVPVLDALRSAHAAGVIHRDLKPDNIFVTREPNGAVGVRVLDFGIARLTRPSEKLTVTGTLVGTPLYMSPEQAGGEPVDQRSDLWSIAALAFECLTGSTPVSGENYGQILSRLIRREVRTLRGTQAALPDDVVTSVDAFFVDRNDRPNDVSSLASVFSRHADPAIEAPPIGAPPPQSSRRFADDGATMLDASTAVRTQPTRAMPAIVAVLAVLALIGTAAGTAAFLLRRQAHPTPVSATSEPPPPSPVASIVAPTPSVSVATTAPAPDVPAPSASVKKVPVGPAVKTVPPPPTASTPKKLPGGVANDTPF